VFLLLLAYFSAAIKQSITTNINLMVTMLLGGLWHGSSWLFIIWGGLNGLGLIVHKFWKKISPFKNTENMGVKIVLMLITLSFISFTRIFFRSTSLQTVNDILDRIYNHMGGDLIIEIIQGYKFVFALLVLGYLIHWIPEKIKVGYRNWFATRHPAFVGLLLLVAVFLMYQLMSGEMQPFIYFQF
jgi:D-alanyl-lipoteichoic acid acyltransferase DltB (MBOAT superfamily)